MNNNTLAAVVLGFGIIGAIILVRSFAATTVVPIEPEGGTVAGGATISTDSTASAGKAVKFGTASDIVISPKSVPNAAKIVIGGETYTAQSPGKTYSMAVDADPSPTYARFELREGDRWINDINNYPNDNRQRAELRGNTYWPLETDIWMSGSLRVTANSWKPGGYNILTQFHQTPPSGEASGTNSLNMSIEDGTLTIYTRGDTAVTTTTRPNSTTRFSRNWGPYIGKWAHFVIRARFSKATASGQLEVWIDGTRVTNATGIVMGFNNPQGPYSKMGIYRSGWTAPLVVEWANREVGTVSLSTRITNPLPTPQ